MLPMDSESNLPRPQGDPDNLRRLREQAQARLEQEARDRLPAPVYGGAPLEDRPPAPVYGGAPVNAVRKVSARWIVLAVAIGLAVIVWLMAKLGIWPMRPAPVYGGPPLPRPGLLLLGRWINRILK